MLTRVTELKKKKQENNLEILGGAVIGLYPRQAPP